MIVDPSILRIQVRALTSLIVGPHNCPGPGTVQHAVVLHYGMDANNRFTPLLQIECLNTTSCAPGTYQRPLSTDPGYRIGPDGTLVADASGLRQWYAPGGEGTLYQRHVSIKRDGTNWASFDPKVDVNSVVMPHEGYLERLISDNRLQPEALLETRPIAEPFEDGGAVSGPYQHSVAWVPVGVTLDSTLYPTEPYRNKAADLVSPCPMSCPPAYLPSNVCFSFRVHGYGGCQ